MNKPKHYWICYSPVVNIQDSGRWGPETFSLCISALVGNLLNDGFILQDVLPCTVFRTEAARNYDKWHSARTGKLLDDRFIHMF